MEMEIPESRQISEKLTTAIDRIRDLYVSKDQGKITNESFAKKIETIESDIKNEATKLGSKGMDALKNILQKSSEKVTGDSGVEKEFREYSKDILGSLGVTDVSSKVESVKGATQKIEPISREQYFGNQKDTIKESSNNTKSINSQVDFGGTINIKVDAPNGVSEQQFKTYFESEEFKKMIYKYYEEKAKELQKA